MNEKVKLVADALRAECLKIFGSSWSNDNAERFARVAIEAMREPTAVMVWVGSEQHEDLPFHQCAEIWQAMIDEALR